MNEPLIGVFYDAATGETITRELTETEIAELPPTAEPLSIFPTEGNDETPSPD
jgi:hypothetical protein